MSSGFRFKSSPAAVVDCVPTQISTLCRHISRSCATMKDSALHYAARQHPSGARIPLAVALAALYLLCVRAAALPQALSVDARFEHTCAILPDGRAVCFGEGDRGRLGTEDTTDVGDSSLRPLTQGIVQLPAGTKAVAISADNSHTCLVLDDGRAVCFGLGFNGRLGTEATAFVGDGPSKPLTQGIAKLPASDFTLLAITASRSTCAIAASATIACWGSNAQGQIGTGSADSIGDDETASSSTALQLPGSPVNAQAVFTGYEHTCAL